MRRPVSAHRRTVPAFAARKTDSSKQQSENSETKFNVNEHARRLTAELMQ
jgi:hypothetical protein